MSRPDVPERIGVVGAGIMGSGIAQLAAETGAHTLLYDAVPEGLDAGMERIAHGLGRLVERGRRSQEDVDALLARLEPARSLDALAGCGLVIEAAPERLALKLELFGELAGIVGDDAVLATNTSSLSVTEIAAGVSRPERVVGLHFFNPAPVMKLVEVVAGAQSGERALALARTVGEAMGKHVIDARDVAGFLVNRCNRPYSLVSLRLLQERVADPVTIDRIARMEGGFRLGPFELMDLVGLDTNHAVAESFQRQSYGEPRYQPSPLQARMVAAGRLGRKTGRGWYAYAEGADDAGAPRHPPTDPEPPPAGGGEGRVLVVRGEVPVVRELAAEAAAAGFDVRDGAAGGDEVWLTLTCGDDEGGGGGAGGGRGDRGDRGDRDAPSAGLRARLLWDASLHASDPEAAGFHVVAPFADARLVEVTRTDRTDPRAAERLEELIRALGRHPEPVADAPGLVLGRILAGLVNEAAFLIGEGNGTAEDVDAGMTLGVNHPRGPIAWSAVLGLRHVVGVLDALRRELGEERYRAAPLLRRRQAVGAAGLADPTM